MAKPRHPNFKKASNLLLVTVVLGLIKLFFSRSEMAHGTLNEQLVQNFMLYALCSLGFMMVLAVLIRFGVGWLKYILLIFSLFGILDVPVAIMTVRLTPVTSSITLVVFALGVWVLILLFRIPKGTNTNTANENVK